MKKKHFEKLQNDLSSTLTELNKLFDNNINYISSLIIKDADGNVLDHICTSIGDVEENAIIAKRLYRVINLTKFK